MIRIAVTCPACHTARDAPQILRGYIAQVCGCGQFVLVLCRIQILPCGTVTGIIAHTDRPPCIVKEIDFFSSFSVCKACPVMSVSQCQALSLCAAGIFRDFADPVRGLAAIVVLHFISVRVCRCQHHALARCRVVSKAAHGTVRVCDGCQETVGITKCCHPACRIRQFGQMAVTAIGQIDFTAGAVCQLHDLRCVV